MIPRDERGLHVEQRVKTPNSLNKDSEVIILKTPARRRRSSSSRSRRRSSCGALGTPIRPRRGAGAPAEAAAHLRR